LSTDFRQLSRSDHAWSISPGEFEHPNALPGIADQSFDLSKPHVIHAALLFVDLINSASLSFYQSPVDYDSILSDFQEELWGICKSFPTEDNVATPIESLEFELDIRGDQLCVFVYDKEELYRNYLFNEYRSNPSIIQPLKKHSLERNAILVYIAIRLAVQLKTNWLLCEINKKRIADRKDPLEVAIGLHFGRVILKRRADGVARVEGYNINVAKRIETIARRGQYTHICLSRSAHDRLMQCRRRRYVCTQFILFNCFETSDLILKASHRRELVYEVKTWLRWGHKTRDDEYQWLLEVFDINPYYYWTYQQLFELLFWKLEDYDAAGELNAKALRLFPDEERTWVNMAHVELKFGKKLAAKEALEKALLINPNYDDALRRLAELDEPRRIEHLRRARTIHPESPLNNYLLGKAILNTDIEDGVVYLSKAKELFPGYPEYCKEGDESKPMIRVELSQIYNQLSVEAQDYLDSEWGLATHKLP